LLRRNGTEVMISMALGGALCTCVEALKSRLMPRPEYWGLKKVHVDPSPLCCWRENVNTSSNLHKDSVIYSCLISILLKLCDHSTSTCLKKHSRVSVNELASSAYTKTIEVGLLSSLLSLGCCFFCTYRIHQEDALPQRQSTVKVKPSHHRRLIE